jgi:hypothetical protein
MPFVDYVELHGDDIAKYLEPGERLIDMGPYNEPAIGDESKLELAFEELDPAIQAHLRKNGQSEPPPPSDKLYEGFSFFGGGIQLNHDLINRWIGGLNGIGKPTSVAGRLWRAGQPRGFDACAVTTYRLLFLIEPKSRDFRIAFEVPRHHIASAELRGKLFFQRGRVEVRFTDGSMIAWTPGMLFATRGRMLVAALTGVQQER